MAQAQENDFIT